MTEEMEMTEEEDLTTQIIEAAKEFWSDWRNGPATIYVQKHKDDGWFAAFVDGHDRDLDYKMTLWTEVPDEVGRIYNAARNGGDLKDFVADILAKWDEEWNEPGGLEIRRTKESKEDLTNEIVKAAKKFEPTWSDDDEPDTFYVQKHEYDGWRAAFAEGHALEYEMTRWNDNADEVLRIFNTARKGGDLKELVEDIVESWDEDWTERD